MIRITPTEYVTDGFVISDGGGLYVIFDSVSRNTISGLDLSRDDMVVGFLSESKRTEELEVIMAKLGIEILNNKLIGL